MDAGRFVFIDETTTATDMTRRYGYWKTTTFVAGLRRSGITAPLGSTDR